MQIRIFEHDEVDSTNDIAFADIARGTARNGDVHTARRQTRGRGRRGRRWHSADEGGLYLSFVHLPPPPPLLPAALTVAAGLALHDALTSLGLDTLRMDWPNDLVVRGKKLAGTLVETRGLDPKTPHYVIGVGVNVEQTRFPEELTAERAERGEPGVTSLKLEGHASTRIEVRDALVLALPRRLELACPGRAHALAALAKDYLAATGLADRAVSLDVEGGPVTGTLRRLDLERGIELDTPQGPQRFDIAHVRGLNPCRASQK